MSEIVGFVGSAHVDRSRNFDNQRCINLFPQQSSSGTSKTAAKLVSAPGLSIWSDQSALNLQGVRGMKVFNANSLFAVIGKKVLRFNADGVGTVIGEVDNVNTPVSIETNGVDLVIVTGPNGYVIDPNTNTVTPWIDPSFNGASAIGFVNGSYVWNDLGLSTFRATLPYSTTINPLWFASAEASPDGLKTLVINQQEVWLMGESTIEVWINDGAAGFPFSRIPGAVIEQGCAAVNSVAKMDNSVFWLSANENGQGLVFRTVGFSLDKVSTYSLEQEIATYETITDATGYTYQQEGHTFYVLNFPTQNITWVYDAATKTWHQRAFLNSRGGFDRHRSSCHAYFARKNLVGDWETGRIYQMSTKIFTDNGNPLVRLRSSPHIAAGVQRIAHHNVEFLVQSGVGITEGQGVNPQVMLRFSDDYGATWSPTRFEKLGAMGEYKKRVRFTRLGSSIDRIYELSCSDPVEFTVLGAVLNAEQ